MTINGIQFEQLNARLVYNDTMHMESQDIITAYKTFLDNKEFPCIAAKAALAKQQIHYFVADHMACPKDDKSILKFLYDFTDVYRKSSKIFHSAAVIFKEPEVYSEEMFDNLLWQRLQALSDIDAQYYSYDQRVDANPDSEHFSFSLKEEAFFIIGLHPLNSRPTRRFKYPTLVFNPHAQFEQMRQMEQYSKMQSIVRKRDIAYSGSVNPMLTNFGEASEVYQYSGRKYDDEWECPLKINHESIKHNSSP